MSVVDTDTGEIARPTLEACERVIESGLDTFVEVGGALLTIRDERLYKQAGFKTFEAYCQERWGFERTRAHRLIDSAQVAALLPMGNIPTNERQARALLPLKGDPAALTEAWNEAQERAEKNGKLVTAEVIEAVVSEKVATAKPASRRIPWTRASAPGGIASQVLSNLRAIADSIAALDVAEYRATQEEVEGLDRTIKALRKLRRSLVIEK